MSLRQAASSLGRQLGGRAASLQHQQQRFAGNLPVKPNKYVEEWGVRREHIENEFRWDAKTLTNIAIFVGIVPALIYKGCVGEFNRVDKVAGRPERSMLGSS
ncbi:hypothetical protein ABPG75_010470 [Micractinium tetrahymenae]